MISRIETVLSVACLVVAVASFAAAQEGQGEFGPEQSGKHNYVTVFEHYFYGRHWNITVPTDCKCVNYPAAALRLISSIHTNGNCVEIYREKGCFGWGLRVEDYSFGYRDLGLVQMQDNTAALKRCGCYDEPGFSSGTTESTVA